MAQAAALKSAREEFDHRARVLRDRLFDVDFLANRGLGNEVGIYLFCYDPALELEARDLVARLVRESENGSLPCRLVERNLYDLVIACCEAEGVLDDFPVLESEEGSSVLLEEFGAIISPEMLARRLEEQFEPGPGALFVTGVGEAYPLVRAHAALNLIHSSFPANPVVLFYPGSFNGHELKLFSKLPAVNYYRAFNLV